MNTNNTSYVDWCVLYEQHAVLYMISKANFLIDKHIVLFNIFLDSSENQITQYYICFTFCEKYWSMNSLSLQLANLCFLWLGGWVLTVPITACSVSTKCAHTISVLSVVAQVGAHNWLSHRILFTHYSQYTATARVHCSYCAVVVPLQRWNRSGVVVIGEHNSASECIVKTFIYNHIFL